MIRELPAIRSRVWIRLWPCTVAIIRCGKFNAPGQAPQRDGESPPANPVCSDVAGPAAGLHVSKNGVWA